MTCWFNPRRLAQTYNIHVQHQKKVQSPKLYFMDTLGGGCACFTAQAEPLMLAELRRGEHARPLVKKY